MTSAADIQVLSLLNCVNRKIFLCEFNYIPLPYVLTEEEKLKKRKIIAAFNAKKESGEPVDEKDMFTQLALVNKTAVNKLEEFEG